MLVTSNGSNHLTPYLTFAFGLSICGLLLLHRLGDTDICPWDEVVHVNVVHNLYKDCCVPKLHSVDLGTDVEDTGDSTLKKGEIAWNNNYIWLHKPLLPFYLRAALYRLFGESLFIFRLPSVVLTLSIALILFVIAEHLSTIWMATAIALLFASNRFIFELTQGRQFCDLTDVMNVFFLTIILGLTLAVAADRPLFFSNRRSSVAYSVASLAAAVFSALAYNSKGGLALPGLAVFAIALVWKCGWRRGIEHIVVMTPLFGVLVFPESFYLSRRFPRQFHYEQRQQIEHLYADVQGHAGPWYYYMTVYWRMVLGLPLGILGFLAMMGSLLPELRNRRNLVLMLWVLCYIVPLSLAVSKVANFTLPVLPAVILLVGFSGHDLLQSERRALLYPLTAMLLLIVVLHHFRVFHSSVSPVLADKAGHRFLSVAFLLAVTAVHRFVLLGISLCTLVVFWFWCVAGRVLGVGSPSISFRVAAAMMALIYFSIVAQNSKDNWTKSNSSPGNHQEQMELKATAEIIKTQVPPNAVILVYESSVGDHRNAHLYVQYWSGLNSLPAQQLDFARRTLSRTHPLYLLIKDSPADGTLIEKVPYGYLYRID
jgi:hypothetical protein